MAANSSSSSSSSSTAAAGQAGMLLDQQQQQQQQALLADLQLQVQRLLLVHVSRDAVSWRCVLGVVEDYGPWINPPLLAAALHALQVRWSTCVCLRVGCSVCVCVWGGGGLGKGAAHCGCCGEGHVLAYHAM